MTNPVSVPDLDAIAIAAAALDEGWSLPYAWMCDPDIHAFEQGATFERSWQVAGLERDTLEAGSYVTCQVGRVPVVVARGEDSALRAFANICRHRGHPVAEGTGCQRLLVCRYHGWSYDLSDRLKSLPAPMVPSTAIATTWHCGRSQPLAGRA